MLRKPGSGRQENETRRIQLNCLRELKIYLYAFLLACQIGGYAKHPCFRESIHVFVSGIAMIRLNIV